MPDPIVPPVPTPPGPGATPEQVTAYYQQVQVYNYAINEPLRIAALEKQAAGLQAQAAGMQAQAVAMDKQSVASAAQATALENANAALSKPPAPTKYTLADVALRILACMPESTAATEATMVASAKARADAFAKTYPSAMQP